MTKTHYLLLSILFLSITSVMRAQCPTNIVVTEQANCGVYQLHLNEFGASGNIIWSVNETTISSGTNNIIWESAESGNHVICAQAWTAACPNGVTICEDFNVPVCSNNDCPTEIAAIALDCNSYVFNIVGVDSGDVIWHFGDETATSTGLLADHSFVNDGVYEVHATYTSSSCPDGVTLTTIVNIDCVAEVTCPDAISVNAGQGCGVMNFEIGSFVEGESVTWFPGDQSGPVEGGHFLSHTYAEAGTYDVCAFYTSPMCPDGIELCTTIVVESCGDCNVEIIATQLDCDSYVFHIGGAENGNVMWSFGDGATMSAGVVSEHTYAENGYYTVSAQYSGPSCPNGTYLVFTAAVQCGSEVVCPDHISSNAGNDCGVMNFEIGSFVEGEAVTWFPGDETGAVETGHFFTHTYAEPGSYNVCAFYTSPACPNGVELCTTIVVESCNTEICPDHISVEYIDGFCYEIGFQAGEPNNEAVVDWYFENETVNDFGDFIWMGFTANDAGGNSVCAYYTSPSCPSGTEICTEFFVCTEEVTCPTEIWSGAGADCGVMNFEIGSFVEGEAVTWFPGDETGAVQTGHFFSHTYAEPGTYDVCAFYTSPACPNGVELCTTIEVLPCGPNDCPTFLTAEQVDCNSFVFHVAGVTTGEVLWNFGDGATESSTPGADHSYAQNGVYVVTAQYVGPNCQAGVTLIYTIEVGCNEPGCPSEIWSGAGEDCGVMNFEIGSFVEGEAVTWFPGDETGAVQTGHFFSHTYAEPGTYDVCAFYTSPACPNGVELCTTIEVLPCGPNDCPTFLTAEQVDCNSFVFHVAGVTTGEVLWNFGDGATESSTPGADHSYAENGVYVVTAQYVGPNCQAGVTLIYTIEVGCNEPGCPSEIWSGAGEDCGVMNFEIGSFVEGEAVTWFPGDETGAVQTGHFFSHTYAAPGTYNVCAFYTSPACPNGVELCTSIVVAPCNTECSDVIIGLDSYINNGGTPNLTYSVINAETQTIMSFGQVDYTVEDPFFDTALCLPDGCYLLTIDNNNPIQIGQGLDVFITMGNSNLAETAEIIYQDNISFSMLFGVNSDCSSSPTCSSEFEIQYTNTPGHIEFSNTSSYAGNATFTWDYGNETTSDGQSGNVWYEHNGVYLVCLTVTTDNCQDTYCLPVSVQNLETACNENLVVLTVTANYPNDLNELVDVILTYEGLEVSNWNLPMFSGFTTTLEACVPDGCYELALSTELPSISESITAQVTVNNQTINVLEFVNGNMSSDMQFGLNSDCVVGVNEDHKTEWALYPNPTSEKITLQTMDGSKLGSIAIYDVAGKLVLNATPYQTSMYSMDLTSFAPGIYVLKHTNANSTQIKRFELVK